MSEKYTYTLLPWESSPDTVRLIELFPGIRDEHLVCTIKEASLVEKPEYEALSYCWGKDKTSNSIICRSSSGRDSSLSVKPNLWAALHQLRDARNPRYLWIDAICINQCDNDEKGRQVLLMRQMYEGAKQTLIWLGSSDADTWRAFQLMRGLIAAKDFRVNKNDTRFYFEMGVKGQQEYGLPGPLDPAFKAFSALMEREWFTRVWIIQEVAVSKVVTMMCGEFLIPWDDFTTAVHQATTLLIPGIWNNTTNCQRIVQLEAARVSVSKEQRQSLLAMLILYRNFNATDMRDKIYSLLGISHYSGPEALHITPNYAAENRTADLYQSLALSILEKTGSLDILCVPRVLKSSAVGQLPSWVPDWSISDFSQTFRFKLPSGEYFLAFEATPNGLRSNVQIKEDGAVIGLEGHIVDHIVEVGKLHSHQTEDELTWTQKITRTAEEQAVLNNWEAVCKARSGTQYSRTGELIFDAYWQTLSAGQQPDGYQAAKEEYIAWDKCVRRPSRFVPTSKSLRWTHGFLSIPLMIATGVSVLTSGQSVKEIMNFRSKMTVATQRRIFRSSGGLIGLVPQLARKGDSVCLFKGCMVPLVMRRAGSRWELIGDSYVHGIMQGAAFEEERCETMWIQ